MSSVALAETKSAIDWIRQFKYSEQLAAAELLNSLQLFDETTVATLISRKLDELVSQGVRAALYAEREIAENAIFKSEEVTDASGRVRSRAMGKGPPAVKPRRGAKRVGSEGFIAFLISQAVKRYPKVFLNQPGPEQFRKSRGKGVRAIVIVTDFIGTGARVRRYLDAFWNVPSVASWHSRRLVSFYVVAASSTPEGMRLIQRHKCKPAILTGFITPTISGLNSLRSMDRWRSRWGSAILARLLRFGMEFQITRQKFYGIGTQTVSPLCLPNPRRMHCRLSKVMRVMLGCADYCSICGKI
jgi:hypothetical protein